MLIMMRKMATTWSICGSVHRFGGAGGLISASDDTRLEALWRLLVVLARPPLKSLSFNATMLSGRTAFMFILNGVPGALRVVSISLWFCWITALVALQPSSRICSYVSLYCASVYLCTQTLVLLRNKKIPSLLRSRGNVGLCNVNRVPLPGFSCICLNLLHRWRNFRVVPTDECQFRAPST